ncbi:MAG: RNase adapter RapZ [Geminicoccaceae bacterium]
MIIVTGMAGDGRPTALHTLEDLGYEAVDNLPIALLTRLIDPDDAWDQPFAIGIDSRRRAFDPEALIRAVRKLRDRSEQVTLLFLDCDDDVLSRRFTETRRRHPLADHALLDGIAREREVTKPLKAAADMALDTSLYSVHDLRREISHRFQLGGEQHLSIAVKSFSFRVGLPREADLVFDVRFLRNPHWREDLREFTGLDQSVQAFISEDDNFAPLMQRLESLLIPLLPAYLREGKSYLTIAVGCTGGKHRSVFVAETLAHRIQEAGWDVELLHRDIPHRGAERERMQIS